MRISMIIVIILFVFVGIPGLILTQYGLLAKVTLSEKNVGPYLLVYQKHIGAYNEVGPIMDKLFTDLKENFAIETTKGFGLYYDNPQEVDREELRSIVGCIVEDRTIEDLKRVSDKYGVKEYPSSQSVVAEFPYKGQMSILIGIFKVYPKLSTFLKENQYARTPIMELYDQPNEKIEYISSVDLSSDIFHKFLE